MFTEKEIEFLAGQLVGRLATATQTGRPRVIPTLYRFVPEHGTIEIPTLDLPDRGQERGYLRNIDANPWVAFVVDDLLVDPWAPRAVPYPFGAERESISRAVNGS